MANYTLDWSDTNLGGTAVVSYLRGAILDFVDKPAGATAALSCAPNLGAGDHIIAEFSIETSGSSVMTFDYHVSSELNWDKLHIDVDGVSQANYSGVVAWTSHAGISIPSAGTHTIRFRFSKDAGRVNEDRVWVANLNITNTVTVNDDTGGQVDIYDLENGSIPSFITTSTWTNSTSQPITGSRSMRSPASTAANGSYDLTIAKGVNARYRVLAFDWKVSSESGWDKLLIFPDASGANVPGSGNPSGEGVPGWLEYSGTANGHAALILPPAASSVLVRYTKDSGGDVGSDAAWVDTIEMPVYSAALNGRWQLEDGTGNWQLEDGSGYWVTEDYEPPAGDTIQAAASLTATSTLAVAAPTVAKPAAASLTSTSTLTAAAPTQTRAAAVSMTATSTLTTAAPTRTQSAAASLTSVSTLTAAGNVLATISAAVSMTGTSTLTAAAFRQQFTAVALAASSTLTAAAVREVPAAVALSSTSALTAAAFRAVASAVSMSASSTLTATVFRTQPVGVVLAAVSTLTAEAVRVQPGAVLLVAASTLTAAAQRTHMVAVSLTAASTLSASAEGDVSGAAALVAVSSLTVAAPQRTLLPAVALSGVSLLTVAAPTRVRPAGVVLTGTSTLTVGAVRILAGAVALLSTSTLTATALGGGEAAVVLLASSALMTAAPQRTVHVAVSFAANSALSVSAPQVTKHVIVQMSATSTLEVVTLRETYGTVTLVSTSTLSALGYVPPKGDISMKVFALMRRNPTFARMRINPTYAVLREN